MKNYDFETLRKQSKYRNHILFFAVKKYKLRSLLSFKSLLLTKLDFIYIFV